MTEGYFILEAADREIDEQVVYYVGQARDAVAERFYAALKATCQSLLENPGCGRRFESTHAALVGVRVWLVQGFPFLVYYREVDEGIELIHVLHGARDRDRILGRDQGPTTARLRLQLRWRAAGSLGGEVLVLGTDLGRRAAQHHVAAGVGDEGRQFALLQARSGQEDGNQPVGQGWACRQRSPTRSRSSPHPQNAPGKASSRRGETEP